MTQMDMKALWGSLGVDESELGEQAQPANEPEPKAVVKSAAQMTKAERTKARNQLLKGLDPKQKRAAVSKADHLLVVAGAGSGKTRVFVHRIARLVLEGMEPDRILALSYTNAAANEVKKRLAEMGVVGVQTSTLHAWCNREPLRKFGHLIGQARYQILDAEGQAETLQYDMRLGEHGAKRVQSELTVVKNFIDESAGGSWHVEEYNAILAKRGQLDFDDLQVKALEVLSNHPEVVLHYRESLDCVLIDEYQDVNPVQHEILRLLCAPLKDDDGNDVRTPMLVTVGDPDQAIYCQPLGTMVEVPIHGDRANVKTETTMKPIEDLVVGENVVTHTNGHVFRKGRPITAVERESFSGELVVVQSQDGHVSKYTPNHHCIVRVSEELRDKHAVYLMRRGTHYRIGRTPFAYASQGGASGLAMRGKSEKADAVWLLSLHDTKKSASTWELILQTKYMIPSVRFKKTSAADMIDVDEFWNQVGDNSDHGSKVLSDYDLEPDFPIWEPGRGKGHNVGIRSPFVTAAANLVTGMTVMTDDAVLERRGELKTPTRNWSPISVSRERYDGDIVSLTVADHHTYFADGILTHNSFRGADDSFIKNFLNEFPGSRQEILDQNYRSTELIINAADRIVVPNNADGRITKKMWTKAGKGEPIKIEEFSNEVMEAAYVADHIKDLIADGVPTDEIAVLYRMHRQADVIAEYLEAARIPFWQAANDEQTAMTTGRKGVVLRTIHSAKGLEWEAVVLIGWSDGIIPSWGVKKDPSQMPEERRIAYVAVTRGKRHVLITSAKETRTKAGGTMSQPRSRFLDVIEGKPEQAPASKGGWGSGSKAGSKSAHAGATKRRSSW
jgi:superfamily I DNA/RNA helicase